MWALRRASNPLKDRAFIIRTFQTSCSNTQVGSRNLYDKIVKGDTHITTSNKCTCFKCSRCSFHGYSKFSLGRCGFSSQADSKSKASEDDDLEDGFSDLEAPVNTTVDFSADSESEISISELSEEEKDVVEGTKEPEDELVVSNSEKTVPEKKTPKKKASMALFHAIMEAPGRSVGSVLDKWVQDGKELDESEVYNAMFNLRKRNMYGKALQFSEWLESSKHIEFDERAYTSRVDLLAKVNGLQAAENYIDKIPESFRTEVTYRTLLANCVIAVNVKKSEEIFNKMKDLGFPYSSFSCNQMLLLYSKTDKRKVADVLLLMEKENVKPSLFTYRLLIDIKGQSRDISGMEQILEAMKAEGIEPDASVQAVLARQYTYSGLKEKAESVLKEIEGDDLRKKKWACVILLPLYASLGKGDDVARVWEICKSNPRLEECMSAVIAWGRLGKVEEAEAAFEKMTKMSNKIPVKCYSALLRVYVNHKMVTKGTDLVKQMADNGIIVGPQTWDDLVNLYARAGNVEKADSILQKASQQSHLKPLLSSYMTIMDQYAKKGDVHNTEKMLIRLRQAGYMSQHRQFETLIQAYINAKLPAYGIRERMKGENLNPNSYIASMLAKVDAFRKTAVTDLLD